MADRIWIWFAENGNIRKWDAKSFHEGTEYIVAAHADAELEEMTRSCLAERKASAEKDARIAEVKSEAIAATTRYQDAENDVHNLRAQLTASRAECEGLRAAGDLYVVWSHEHSCWWRANSQGYARRIEDAGVYTRDEALSISHRGRDGWRPEEKPDELPVRVADLPEFARAALSQKETGNAA